ncbi:MAG: hypothetical protein JWM68_1351 [Verrucomicrobiales bacterium]|nr:hypothetical protein [Verrucomicrobiales bacterium]
MVPDSKTSAQRRNVHFCGSFLRRRRRAYRFYAVDRPRCLPTDLAQLGHPSIGRNTHSVPPDYGIAKHGLTEALHPVRISYMDREEIVRVLMESIREVQELSGCEKAPIDLNTCPIRDLADFDSLRGAETAHFFMTKLKRQFSMGKDDNIFISEDGRRALRVSEITDRLVQLLKV